MLQNELPTYIIVLPQQAKVAFVATSIGAVARTSGKSYGGVYDRKVRRGLIFNYIYPCYDTLYTNSRENFVADLLQCLDNWEGGAVMSNTTVYQGATQVVGRPVCRYGMPNLGR